MLIYRTALEITNGVSSTKDIQVSSINLSGGEVKQVQFVEDGTIFVLHTDDGIFSIPLNSTTNLTTLANKSRLVNFSIYHTSTGVNTKEASSNQFHPPYEPYGRLSNNTQLLPEPLKIDIYGDEADLVIHSFSPSGSKSRPIRLNVSGRRKERRAACVLYADQVHYEVLDIDSQVHDEDEAMEE